jgi:hypothetical protein
MSFRAAGKADLVDSARKAVLVVADVAHNPVVAPATAANARTAMRSVFHERKTMGELLGLSAASLI